MVLASHSRCLGWYLLPGGIMANEHPWDSATAAQPLWFTGRLQALQTLIAELRADSNKYTLTQILDWVEVFGTDMNEVRLELNAYAERHQEAQTETNRQRQWLEGLRDEWFNRDTVYPGMTDDEVRQAMFAKFNDALDNSDPVEWYQTPSPPP